MAEVTPEQWDALFAYAVRNELNVVQFQLVVADMGLDLTSLRERSNAREFAEERAKSQAAGYVLVAVSDRKEEVR